jgi:hypothetical protein
MTGRLTGLTGLNKVLIWTGGAVALYAAAGMLVVPPVVKSLAVDYAQEQLGRRLEIGGLSVNPFAFSATVEDVVLYEAGEAGPDTFLSVGELYADLTVLPVLFGRLTVPEIRIDRPFISVVTRSDSTFNFDDLVERALASADSAAGPGAGPGAGPDAGPGVNDAAEPDAEPWDIIVDSLVIEGFAARLADQTTEPHAEFRLLDGNLRAAMLHPGSNDTAGFAVSIGSSRGGSVKGDGYLLPAAVVAHANVSTDNISLVAIQGYVERYTWLEVTSGGLYCSGVLDAAFGDPDEPSLTFAGDLTVTSFNLHDNLKDQRFAGWDSLSIRDLRAELSPLSIRTEEIRVDSFYLRLEVAADQSLNAKDVIKLAADSTASGGGAGEAAQGGPDPGAAPAESLPDPTASDLSDTTASGLPHIYIGRVVLNTGEADFADFSLPLPFATHIHSMNGTISEIVAGNPAGSAITARGSVDTYGFAKVDGAMDPFSPMSYTDFNVGLTNIEMTRLTPYSGKFAGYRIDKGTLTLDLEYEIRNGQLVGKNDIRLEKLTLGEKIESEEATSLPVKLAIALLKDADGNIDLDMEVEGDLNDPEVNVASLAWQAFTKVLTNVVTAPFSLLGGLIGISGDELEYVRFEPGRTELPPPSIERLENLVKAMNQRPSLRVVSHGGFDRTADANALKSRRLDSLVSAKVAVLAMGMGDTIPEALRLQFTRTSLEQLHVEAFSAEALSRVKAAHTTAASDGGAGTLDLRAYQKTIRTALLERLIVPEEVLASLGDARASAIVAWLTSTGGLPAARISTGEGMQLDDEDDEWVECRLTLEPVDETAGVAPDGSAAGTSAAGTKPAGKAGQN